MSDYRIMLARTRAARRGATPLEIQIQVLLLDGVTWCEAFPDRLRMQLRADIESVGSLAKGYTPRGILTAVGQDYSALRYLMLARGFRLDQMVNFPLGTDKPPQHLRHDGGSAWCFARWEYTGPMAHEAGLAAKG